MRRRFNAPLLLACMTAVMMVTSTATAQYNRPERGLYIYPKIGLTQYTGDRDTDLTALFDNYWRPAPGEKNDEPGFPWGAALEVGFQLNPGVALGGEFGYGFYPKADDPLDGAPQFRGDDWNSTWGKALVRFTAPTGAIMPFIGLGVRVQTAVEDQFDEPGDEALGVGPEVDLGFEFAVADRASIMLELQNFFSFPDDGFDGLANENVDNESNSSFDLLNMLSLGVKYNFGAIAVAPDITDLDCPENITAGQTATFRAELNDDATQPVDLRWDFGTAGATGSGESTSFVFNQPGTYTVTATATNEAGENVETCVVNVARAPVNAAISTLTGPTGNVCVGQAVNFNTNVTGDAPLNYSWNFGNGRNATGAAPSATFDRPGTYTVTLTATGATGVAATRTMTVNVVECGGECDDITELNSVYFPRNSSTLTAEGRAALGENLEILRECPDLCVRLEGWASTGERNPQQLSEDRARAVAEFYQTNGIAAARIAAVGRGAQGGTKKEGGTQNQRVDSIPVPCEDLNR